MDKKLLLVLLTIATLILGAVLIILTIQGQYEVLSSILTMIFGFVGGYLLPSPLGGKS